MLPHLKNNSPDKTFFLYQWYLPLFAYTHAEFERVEALLKGQARCLKTATYSHYDLNDTGIGVAKKILT